ncbi:MAG: hypothetical protein M3Y91_15340, partial [Actinomycetota bacterium]|nr:hypothetical protein [Actinomycetota bacterium]
WRFMCLVEGWLDGSRPNRGSAPGGPTGRNEMAIVGGDICLSAAERRQWSALQARAGMDSHGMVTRYRAWRLNSGLRRTRLEHGDDSQPRQ